METYRTFTQNDIDDMDSQTKPLSWEELKEKAKGMRFYKGIGISHITVDGWLKFMENGTILTDIGFAWQTRASNVSYEKMLMIMRGLE